MIHVYFQHLYTYMPILDHSRFMERYWENNCSTFLLYAIFIVTVPFISNDDLQHTGYVNAPEAQSEFFTRARLLYDFGCEQHELNLLQGSILLSSFHHMFEPPKDFRYWFGNAARMATQMGLHRT
jgi:hypothetical protein